MLALYATIWVSLTLFTAAELGRARHPPRTWAWPAFVLGLALALTHTILSFAIVHGWSHRSAVAATAEQTAQVFGIAVGAGLYVNYVFFAVWFADAMWWRVAGGSATRPAAAVWALRAFYLVIIFNGAVIFAAGWRRAIGIALVVTLVLAWTRATRGTSSRLR